MGLREQAATLAGRDDDAPADWPTVDAPDSAEEPDAPGMPESEIPEPGPDGPEQVPVAVAWSRVMGEVRAIGKGDQFDGGRAGRFAFRGVDRALNAFGPACRRHGVLVIPAAVEPEYRDVKTSSGGNMRECTVTVTYNIYGPKGDHIPAQAAGEALDTGGRSTPKAQSVALRTLLLSAGLVPTELADADAVHIERGDAPVRPPASYRDEVLDPSTSKSRLRQIHHEVRQHGLASAVVVNETGDDEQLGVLVVRIGKERAA